MKLSKKEAQYQVDLNLHWAFITGIVSLIILIILFTINKYIYLFLPVSVILAIISFLFFKKVQKIKEQCRKNSK